MLLTSCQSAAPETTTQAPETTTAAPETTTEAEKKEEEMQEVPMEELNVLPTGDIAELSEVDDIAEASAEEVSRITRAMRDYVPPEENLLVNNAEHFYYYEQLSEEEQKMYETMYWRRRIRPARIMWRRWSL